MNLSYGVAGMIIMLCGVLLVLVSAPVLKYSVRMENASQISPMMKWFAKGLGLVLFMLGFVTLLNQ